MILYPAIDLKEGQCVRLAEGDMGRATVFNADPAAQARAFFAAGARHLHVVDLDGAFAGAPRNAAAVAAILAAVPGMAVQLGGGIRSLDRIEAWLAAGIARVILGTAAVRDPELVRAAARAHPGRIAVGIDARGGRVAVAGWAEATEVEVVSLAKQFEDAGVAALVYTDIGRDGLLTGLNIEATAALARAVRLPVIASGGLKGIEDIAALCALPPPGVAGAIAGRALYEGRLDLKAALGLTRRDAPC